MTDVAEELRSLLDYPANAPEPVEELHRRVGVRRRRRARRRSLAAGLAAVAMSIAVVPILHRADDQPTRIATVPAPAIPAGPRLEYSLPEGWQTLYAEGNRLAVATDALSDRDRELALLTRSDASFRDLPPDAVVVAVGADPLDVKYGTNWDGSVINAGPAYGLGPERVLAGGVRFRKGDVPQSIVQIASYAGPDAPASRLREAEAVAASIRLVGAGGTAPPAPPAGSASGASAAPQALKEVARAGTGPSSVVLEADADCAYFRPAGSQPHQQGHDRLGGGCGTRPAPGAIATIGSAVLVWGEPGTAPSSATAMRVGPDVKSVSARTADGRTFPAALGATGWGVAVGPGRIVGLTAIDSAGRQTESFVP